jgi:hypothetical protein
LATIGAALSGLAELLAVKPQRFALGFRMTPLRGSRTERRLAVCCVTDFNARNEEETRMPKSEIRKKPEVRNPNERADDKHPGFGTRVSDFFRISTFGFRHSLS